MQHILDNQNNQLQSIISKSKRLACLDQQVKKNLLADLAPHCTVANLQAGHLVIAVDSAVWATHLRYQIPELLQKLRTDEQVPQLITIRCYVKQAVPEAKKRSREPLKLSQQSIDNIISTAGYVKDEALQQALLRLAKQK
ncbi:MAG: DciA family protein [Gammaproteobacteria bacterium]